MKQRSASLDWWETCIPIDTSGARVSTSAWNTQVVRIADIGQVAGCSFRPFDFRSSRFFSPSTGSDPRFKKAGCGIQFVNRAENFANSQPKFVLSGSLTLLPLLPSSRFHLCLICVPQLFFLYGSIRIRRWWILFYSLLILELKSCWENCIFILSKLQQIFSYKIHDLAWLVNELVCFSTPSSFKFIRGKSNI